LKQKKRIKTIERIDWQAVSVRGNFLKVALTFVRFHLCRRFVGGRSNRALLPGAINALSSMKQTVLLLLATLLYHQP
jgi:hypothetical protein